MADASEQTKSASAKKRAAKKARDAAAAESAPPAPAPAPTNTKAGYPEGAAAPKAKAKGKAKAEPAPAPAPAAPEPKAKAKAKAKAAAEPVAAAAEPKAKAKAKAKAAAAEPKAAPEPPAPEPKAKAKAKGKAAASKAAPKAAAKAEEVEEPKKKAEELINFVMDDGSGDTWEVNTGLSKKQQKRKEREEEEAKVVASFGGKPGQPAPTNFVPGMSPAPSKGVAKAGAAPVADQSVAISAAVAAARAAGQAAEEATKPEGNATTVNINVPESKIGIVIGPKGAKIKMIQEKTGVTRIDTSGDVFTVSGPPEAVAAAQTAIKELIEKGYTSLSFDNFSENFVTVHPSVFPDLIGKQGAVIRKIKEELGTEINIPPVPKNADPKKKFKVGIAGSAAAVEKAKTVINEIINYGHSEVTHPGYMHEELEIAQWSYSFLIGKGGSEMRHIQNNYKVKVNIPRETSANQNVVIVGEKENVPRAKAYIDKLIWNAENNVKGRDRADGNADDGWGDEDAEEDWMKAYLFKR